MKKIISKKMLFLTILAFNIVGVAVLTIMLMPMVTYRGKELEIRENVAFSNDFPFSCDEVSIIKIKESWDRGYSSNENTKINMYGAVINSVYVINENEFIVEISRTIVKYDINGKKLYAFNHMSNKINDSSKMVFTADEEFIYRYYLIDESRGYITVFDHKGNLLKEFVSEDKDFIAFFYEHYESRNDEKMIRDKKIIANKFFLSINDGQSTNKIFDTRLYVMFKIMLWTTFYILGAFGAWLYYKLYIFTKNNLKNK